MERRRSRVGRPERGHPRNRGRKSRRCGMTARDDGDRMSRKAAGIGVGLGRDGVRLAGARLRHRDTAMIDGVDRARRRQSRSRMGGRVEGGHGCRRGPGLERRRRCGRGDGPEQQNEKGDQPLAVAPGLRSGHGREHPACGGHARVHASVRSARSWRRALVRRRRTTSISSANSSNCGDSISSPSVMEPPCRSPIRATATKRCRRCAVLRSRHPMCHMH